MTINARFRDLRKVQKDIEKLRSEVKDYVENLRNLNDSRLNMTVIPMLEEFYNDIMDLDRDYTTIIEEDNF